MLYNKRTFQIFIFALSLISGNCWANINQTVLPLSFSPQGMPAVTVEIQGKKIPLAFGAGSANTSIALSEKIIKQLHLKLLPSDKTVCVHNSAGKEFCYQSFIIPVLKAGNFTMYNVKGVMRDYQGGEKPDPKFIITDAYKNGVIGSDVLSQFNVLLDYPHEQAVLMKHGLYPKNYNVKNWVKIPFELNKYGITTTAKINGVDTLLSWGTAGNHSVIRQSTMNKIAHVPSAYKSFVPEKFIVGNVVGNRDIPTPLFYIVDEELPFDTIGSSFFQENLVFIDFKNKYLFIQK